MMVDEYVKRRDDVIKTLRANGLAGSENEARRIAEGMLATEVSVQKNFDKQKEENTFGFKMKNGASSGVINMVDTAINSVTGARKEIPVDGNTSFKIHVPTPAVTKPAETKIAEPSLNELMEEKTADESPMDRGEMFKFD